MISIENVQQAAKMIKGTVIKTPLVYSPSLSKMFEGKIYLKLENLQKNRILQNQRGNILYFDPQR